MTNKNKKHCFLCTFIPMLLSGSFGYLAGSLAHEFGASLSLASTISGFVGFMGAQTFSLACLLFTTRYRRKKKV